MPLSGMNSAVTGFVHFRHTESESPALASDVVPASIPFQTVLQAAQIVRLSQAGAEQWAVRAVCSSILRHFVDCRHDYTGRSLMDHVAGWEPG
jgi:hypothetical protein